ncbi:MAG: heme-binding protein [Halodesulfurarchaeum sp.]
MVRRQAPLTEEGWYVLHDFRRIDWDGWRSAPERRRKRAIEEGRDYLDSAIAVEGSDEGGSAVYSILGAKADILLMHLRPSMAALDHIERAFEQTELASFTERADSFVSVTEASGYSDRAREYLEGELDERSGLAKYIRSRLEPEIPDAEHVSFYPMDKRRNPEYNWYDLPFEERAEHMDHHGVIGREYAGKVTQMITGAIGMDDWEWGVTLWAEDITDVKQLLYEMRFDPSSSKYAAFGPFWVGRRMVPADLPAYLAGEPIETAVEETTQESDVPATPGEAVATEEDGHPHETAAKQEEPTSDGHPGSGGRPDVSDVEYTTVEDLDARLYQLGLREGEDYEGGEYGLLFYSDADAADLAEEVSGLRDNFEHYDRHVETLVRASGGRSAVASLWTAQAAAETAAGFLGDLPSITERYGGELGENDEDGSNGNGAATDNVDSEAIRAELAEQNVYAGSPHGEDIYAMVVYSTADLDTLEKSVDQLRTAFEAEPVHVDTTIYETGLGEVAGIEAADPIAVVSQWESETGADTAGEALSSLPEIVGRPEDTDGFGTMGMFYTVKPDFREEFVDTFDAVGEKLATMEGHRGTALLVNHEDDTDMFIASNWDNRDAAMEFFRSADFRKTVEWGREVLADQPRHVFLA